MNQGQSEGYGKVAKLLHWIVALAVTLLFAVGLWMVDLDYYSSWYQTAPHYHKSAGILLGLIMVARLVWRLKRPLPAAPEHHSQFEKQAASVTHRLLYLLVFLMVISGYLISTADGRPIAVFNWFEIPAIGSLIENQEDLAGEVHEWLAYILIGLASLHALAAIKHHFIDKDDTLKRML